VKNILRYLNQDRGSQSILGIGAAVFVLALTLVTVSSTQLFRQQEQVRDVADSLALDLADLLRHNALERLKDPLLPKVDIAYEAPQELNHLANGSTSARHSNLRSARQVGDTQVAVTVCQASALAQLPIIDGFAGPAEICAKAQAKTLLPG